MAAEWIATTSSGVTAPIVGSGLVGLVLADVLRPSLSWQMARRARHMQERFPLVRDPEGFARLQTLAGPARWASLTGRRAVNDLTKIMVAKGGKLADITVGDALEYRTALREHHRQSAGHTLFYAWLRRLGTLPDDAPTTLRNLGRATGQVGIEQLVDRYDLTCQPVRDLLVDYLTERRPGLDYATLDNLSRFLALHFWADLEVHHPGIDSLHLPAQVALQWKQRAQTKTVRRRRSDGTYDEVVSPRLDGSTLLIAVRALYLDLARWAGEEPARWGPWVAPCPIGEADLNVKKHGQRVKARMDQRTRQRLPALPTVVCAAKELLDNAQIRLQAVQIAPVGGRFEVLGETFARAKRPGSTWVYDDCGRRRDLAQRERRAFWGWAMVEFLQHTGARIEEMLEASHHSLIQYRLPTTGEVVPLLQIAPSKTDQERVLLVSPELADVLSTIITRVRDSRTGAVPQVAAYDYNERVWNPPMPLLFQYDRSGEISAMNGEFLRKCLNDVLDATGLTDADGCPLDFDPHDFRRIFITDAIRSGLPPPPPHTHRPGHRRTLRHQHHHGLQRHLPGRSHRGPPRVHRPPPSPASQRGIPHPHLRGVGRLPRPLRTTQALRRHLRPRLRHLLYSRTRLHSLLHAPPRPCPTRPPDGDPRQPSRSDHRSRTRRMAGRDRRTRDQPHRSPGETRLARCRASPHTANRRPGDALLCQPRRTHLYGRLAVTRTLLDHSPRERFIAAGELIADARQVRPRRESSFGAITERDASTELIQTADQHHRAPDHGPRSTGGGPANACRGSPSRTLGRGATART
ncbi:hypothetical protein [Streptomyces sp. NPDC055506]